MKVIITRLAMRSNYVLMVLLCYSMVLSLLHSRVFGYGNYKLMHLYSDESTFQTSGFIDFWLNRACAWIFDNTYNTLPAQSVLSFLSLG